MKLFIASLSIAIMLLFTSCKTALQIEKPHESYLPSTIAPSLSEFPLKVDLDVKKLETAINNKMTGLIYEGTNISNKDLSIKIWKAQNFTFTINNNVIEYKVPLKIWSKFAWQVEKFGLAVGDTYEANGSIVLTFKTTINFDKNWGLISKTTSSGYQWIDTPKLNVIGVSVPVTPIANLALSSCNEIITKQIDKTLAESVNLKKYVSEAWSEMQKPRLVSPENKLWIRITPKDIYVSPFVTVGNKLNMSIALYAGIESFMGVQPAATTAVPLPDFKYVNRPAQQFNINLGIDVTYAAISEMTKKELINKTFSEGNKSITINDLELYGSDGKTILMADVTGAIKGKIYFTGNMIYNPEKVSVEILDPQFDIKTQSALVKTANWLLHGMILKKMAPYLTYSVKEELDSMKNEVNQMLSNYSVYEGVSLQGKLNTIDVTSLSLIPGAVRIQANAKGNVAMKIDDLKF